MVTKLRSAAAIGMTIGFALRSGVDAFGLGDEGAAALCLALAFAGVLAVVVYLVWPSRPEPPPFAF